MNTGNPLFSTGIIPHSEPVNDYCTNKDFFDPAKCSDFLEKDKLKADLEADCVGK